MHRIRSQNGSAVWDILHRRGSIEKNVSFGNKFERNVIPACQELEVGIVPFSPLGAGFLSGKYTSKNTFRV